jgi:hypothetical protein
MPRPQHLCALRVLTAAILDVLRLVERDKTEVFRPQRFNITPQEGVGGDDKIGARDFGAARGAIRARIIERA